MKLKTVWRERQFHLLQCYSGWFIKKGFFFHSRDNDVFSRGAIRQSFSCKQIRFSQRETDISVHGYGQNCHFCFETFQSFFIMTNPNVTKSWANIWDSQKSSSDLMLIKPVVATALVLKAESLHWSKIHICHSVLEGYLGLSWTAAALLNWPLLHWPPLS